MSFFTLQHYTHDLIELHSFSRVWLRFYGRLFFSCSAHFCSNTMVLLDMLCPLSYQNCGKALSVCNGYTILIFPVMHVA